MTAIRNLRENRLKKIRKAPEWPLARHFKYAEMEPIIESLAENKVQLKLQDPLRKYLIISSVTLIENFLLRLARRTIDNNNIPISVFGNKFIKEYNKRTNITIGEFVASYSSLSSPYIINNLFTTILNTNNQFSILAMSFFEAVRKIDWYDPFRHFKGVRARYLYKNWDKFINMIKFRNMIVHEMTNQRISNMTTFSFCDNTLNFLEAAIALCAMDNDIFSILQSTKQVNK